MTIGSGKAQDSAPNLSRQEHEGAADAKRVTIVGHDGANYYLAGVNSSGQLEVNSNVSVTVTATSVETVTCLQGTSPWVVTGTVGFLGTVNTTETVTSLQGTIPWIVDGTVTVIGGGSETVTCLQGTSPWIINGTVGVTGNVGVTQGTVPWVVDGTVTVIGGGSETVTCLQGTNPWIVDATFGNTRVQGILPDGTAASGANPVLVGAEAFADGHLHSIQVYHTTAGYKGLLGINVDLDGNVEDYASSGESWARVGSTDNTKANGTFLKTAADGTLVLPTVTVDGTVAVASGGIETVTCLQGTSPWIVDGTISVEQATSPWIVNGTVGVTGTVAVTQSTSPWVINGTIANPATGAFSALTSLVGTYSSDFTTTRSSGWVDCSWARRAIFAYTALSASSPTDLTISIQDAPDGTFTAKKMNDGLGAWVMSGTTLATTTSRSYGFDVEGAQVQVVITATGVTSPACFNVSKAQIRVRD